MKSTDTDFLDILARYRRESLSESAKGGKPEVRWGDYEKSVVHVRTSHLPRFEVELPSLTSTRRCATSAIVRPA
jgi:hypothetical protein